MGESKTTHGGAGRGQGRKPLSPGARRAPSLSITLTAEDRAFLEQIAPRDAKGEPNLSAAVRQLIAEARARSSQ